MSKVKINNREVDFDAAVNLMDDEIRETLHAEWDDKSAGNLSPEDDAQFFVDAYAAAHKAKYGADFVVN